MEEQKMTIVKNQTKEETLYAVCVWTGENWRHEETWTTESKALRSTEDTARKAVIVELRLPELEY